MLDRQTLPIEMVPYILWRLVLLAAPLAMVSQPVMAVRHRHLSARPESGSPGNVEPPPDAPVNSRNGTILPFYSTIYYFDQLIDHNNPSRGTFKQRYWFTSEFYADGGPIIMWSPGEGAADTCYGYFTNMTMNGQIAQQQNGSTIVLEHRFYGLSNPFPDLSVESLQVHTIQQAIDDFVYFAYNAVLPMPGGDQVTPDEAPWILMGRSYAGSLVAYTMVNKPGVFYAGYSSSGTVEAIVDFWQLYEPIRENMPKNCSADVQAVIAHIDEVFASNNSMAIQDIKDSFGLSEINHLDDVASVLQSNLADWQSMDMTTGPGSDFYLFCDALEVKDGESAPPSGWGLDHALPAWASYFKNVYLHKICGDSSAVECIDTYNATQPYWTDTSINNADRSYFWTVCHETGHLQPAAPAGHPSLVSRFVKPVYELRWCQQYFPEEFPTIPTIDTNRTNQIYKGWDMKVDRLFFATGTRDDWRDATMATRQRNIQSTEMQPIVLADGFHGSDMITKNNVDPSIMALQKQALAYMGKWLSDWKPNSDSA